MSNSSSILHLEQMVQNENKDRLSSLPDDILVSILLLIDDINHAARSSILSRRWRYLAPYSYFTNVDFDARKTSSSRYNNYNDVRPKFLNWVHQVVTSHRAPFINDLRVCFPLSQADSNSLCTWIEFAFSKGVKKLELDFSINDLMNFPPHFSLCSFPSSANFFKGSCFMNNNASSNLTSLCLRFVNISGELLELLLSHFHLLERLHVESSRELQNLKIINSSEKLKHLAVHRCDKLEQVEIHAVNLVSFELSHFHELYEPPTVNVIYTSVPSLVDARFCWRYCHRLRPYFLQLHCFAAQLTKLSLQMELSCHMNPHELPSFANVKDLELQVTVGHHPFDLRHMNLLRLRCYAEACPVLDNVKLQVHWRCDCGPTKEIQLFDSESDVDVDFDTDYDSDFDLDFDSGPEEYSLEEVKEWLEEKEGSSNATLPLLRKLEWSAIFSNHVEAEYELALYFVKNAVMLEKFICDPQFRDMNWNPCHAQPTDVLIHYARRQRARKLATAIPSRIHFTIL